MAIQMRRGEKKDFQPEKLKVGEFAVPTDTGEVYIKTSENTTKGIATLKANGKLEQMPDYSDVGAAPKNHASSDTTYGISTATNYGHASASSTTPLVAGTANVGTETSKFARGDHVHPVQTSVSGNAGTATKLQTARTIATSGGATGTATSFNGSANITIPVTAINPTYLSSATPINKGGTGAATADAALSNLGAVPQSRTINNKALSADISLTPSDIGAAASNHGNHVPTTQTASNKVFLRNDNSWQTVTPENIGTVPTTRKVNNKALSADITLSYSDVGAAASSHNHSASNITSGTLPIERGGTGAASASTALSNLGMTISSGTWTPTLSSREGTDPTYSVYYRYAMYYRINNLVYVTFHMKVNITSAGTNYACVRGLPFTAASNMNGQALAIRECYGGISYYPACANIQDSSSVIFIQNPGGEAAQQWKTGDTWIGFSGCYIKA